MPTEILKSCHRTFHTTKAIKIIPAQMNHTEVDNCIRILKEKPTGFLRKENISEKLQCFDTIQKVGTSHTIYFLIDFLKHDNILLRIKAAETIVYLFAKIKSLNDYTDALKHLPIKTSDLDFYRVDFDTSIYVKLLCIASLNSSGYVREKSVKELSSIKNPEGLKFILLRLGDWVDPVRKIATEAILSFLESSYIDDLLKQLETIDWLLKVKRIDLREIHTRIIQFILSHDFSDEFYNKIKRLNDKTRFRFYKKFLSNKKLTAEQLNKIMGERNFLVRLHLMKHLSSLDTVTQKEVIGRFLQDHSAKVRLEALYVSKPFRPDFDSRISLLLSDESTSVRELSRHFLKEHGIDFAALYRQRIDEGILLSGSLCGLSESGSSQDLPIFEKYISAKKSDLIIASLIAINRFNAEKAKQYSLELLVHPTKSIRDKAVEILARNLDTEALEKVRDIYANGSYDIKKSILKLYNKIGGWNIVGDLLIAISDENKDIQDIAWELLAKWKLNAIRLFTTPPKSELERANRIYDSLNINKLRMTYSRTKLLEELKFYLR